MKPLLSIQYLRAVAALAVVSYHAGQWVTSDVAVGAAGVDIFFVISGFVMWTSTWAAPAQPAVFLRRRVRRVVPLYWLLTLMLAGFVLLLPGVVPNVTPEPWHIVRSMLFIPHTNPQGDLFPLLAVGWTLNYEAMFYLVFAAGLLLPRDRRMIWLAGILAPLSMLGFLYFPIYSYGANPMMLQFLAGAVVGRLWVQRDLPGPRVGLLLVLAAAAMFAAAELIDTKPDSLLRPLTWGLPALALVLGAVSIEGHRALKASAFFKRLGDASYSLYLVHTPVMAVFNKIIGPTDPLLFFTLAMALSVAAGLVCHQYVEKPLLALFRSGRNAPAQAVAGAS